MYHTHLYFLSFQNLECLSLDIPKLFEKALACHQATRRPPAYNPTEYQLCLYNETVELCYKPLRGCTALDDSIEQKIYYYRLNRAVPENCTHILEAARQAMMTTQSVVTSESPHDEQKTNNDGKKAEQVGDQTSPKPTVNAPKAKSNITLQFSPDHFLIVGKASGDD